MRDQVEGGRPRAYLAIAKSALDDRDNDCRWQAAIVIGEFIPFCPEEVWTVVEQYGVSKDDDMRTCVSTVLLEHLLDHYPNRFRTRCRALARESKLFADVLKGADDWVARVRGVQCRAPAFRRPYPGTRR